METAMNDTSKRLLLLTAAIQEVVDFIENNKPTKQSACDKLVDALLSFGLPKENQMIALLRSIAADFSRWDEFKLIYKKWFDAQIIALANTVKTSPSYKTGQLGCDRRFGRLIATIKNSGQKKLVDYAMDCLKKISKENPTLYNLLTVGYRGWYFENNWLDGFEGKNNSLVENRINTLKNNVEKIEWLYDHLEDNLSRVSLNALITNWLTFSMEEALNVSAYSNGVINPDIFPLYENEVFVDCGAHIGDTVAEFVNEFNQNYKAIHTYDISEATVEIMKNNLKDLKNVFFNIKGVSDKRGILTLAGVDAPFHGNRLIEGNGTAKIPVVSLDEDITEPITFLKIDVEGLDKEAIWGARNHIAQYHPKLHIDTYHKLVDFFEVPLLIQKIDPTYRFYLRLINSIDKPLMFATTCIYAI